MNKVVLSLRLNVFVLVSDCREVGREFQAEGPANVKERSPNLSLVAACSFKLWEVVERSPLSQRAGMLAVAVTRSVMYEGLRPM